MSSGSTWRRNSSGLGHPGRHRVDALAGAVGDALEELVERLSGDVAGGHDVHPDALGAQLLGQGLRRRHRRLLGRGVGRLAGRQRVGAEGADVHDRAAAAGGHRAGRAPADLHGADHVDLEGVAPHVPVGLVDRDLAAARGGDGDEGVDAPHAGHGLVDQRHQRVEVGEVRHDRLDPAARLGCDLGRQLGQRLRPAGRHHHVGAVAGEGQRTRPTQSGAGPHDERHRARHVASGQVLGSVNHLQIVPSHRPTDQSPGRSG